MMASWSIEAVAPKAESPATKPLVITKDRHLFQEKFLRDAAGFKGNPEELAIPYSEAQIAALLERANDGKKAIVVVGGGTALTGASVAHGGTVVSTNHFNRLLRIEKFEDGSGTAAMEPGMRLGDFLERVEEKGLFYLPGPTHPDAFFGGMVNTNAAGAPSYQYGRTGKWIQRLRIALPIPNAKGKISILEVERGKVFSNIGGEFEMILLGGERLLIPARTYSFPSVKHTGGYASGVSLDLIDLFIGSEGTLGIVTEVQVTLLDREGKEDLLSGLLFFKTLEGALQLIQALKKERPQKIRRFEFFDSGALQLLGTSYPEIPQEALAALLFEEEVSPTDEEEHQSGWLSRAQEFDLLSKKGAWFASCNDHATQRKLLELRGSLPVLVNRVSSHRKYRKIGTDFVIPEKIFVPFTKSLFQDLSLTKIPYLAWMHVWDSHYHINFLPETDIQFERAESWKGKKAKEVISEGGSASGEHGFGEIELDIDGKRYGLAELHFGANGVTQMARTKRALDPNLILNPGKVIPLKWLKT